MRRRGHGPAAPGAPRRESRRTCRRRTFTCSAPDLDSRELVGRGARDPCRARGEDDPERALELLLEETVRADSERRERMRELAVALFAELRARSRAHQRYRR